MPRCILVGLVLFGSIAGLTCLSRSVSAIDRFWDSGNGNWITSGNWDPAGVPETGDDVFIGTYLVANDAVVTFGLFPPYIDTVTNLTIENGADLDLNGGRLTVLEHTVVGGGFDKSPFPQLIASPVEGMPGVDALDTNTLTISSAGRLIMSGASISVDGTGAVDGVLEVEIGGGVFGYGSIDLDDTNLPTARVLMINDGTITVDTPDEFVIGEPTPRILQINAPNAAGLARIDLGGNVVITRNCTLELNLRNTVNVPTADIVLFGNATLDLGGIYASNGGSLIVNSGPVFGAIVLPAVPAVVTGEVFSLGPNSSLALDQSDEVLVFESEFRTTDSGAEFATITNSGTIHFEGDATISSLTDIVASGTGRLVNDFGSTLTLHDGLDADTPLTNDGILLLGFPALAAADVQIDSYTQTETGRVVVQVGGVIPGQFDSLIVEGNAAIEGHLVVGLINDFEPVLGNSFPILETVFGNVTGTFDVEILPVFNGLTFDVVYNPQSVVLQVVEALPGDYNDDGVVDAADYVAWRNNVGAAPGTLPNDIDGGIIGDAQYATWRTNFGNASGGGSLASATVPEPTGLLLLIVAWAARGRWTKMSRA